MPATVIVGLQWGDEGKGKATDFLAEQVRWVVRYQGGDNAGHTIVLGKEVFKLHLVPSGVLYPHIAPLIGPGVVVNPATLIHELDGLAARGIDTSRVRVSHAAHVILPYHIAQDRASEVRLGREGIGTTNRGIGPAYADRASRVGARMGDLLDEAALRRTLERVVPDANARLAHLGDTGAPFLVEAILEAAIGWGERLRPVITDTTALVQDALRAGDHVLLEGAQGTLLDLDHGSYPFVTSSNPVAGGACTGGGIGPLQVSEVIGVMKAYTTRVGAGPYPTELQRRDRGGDRHARPRVRDDHRAATPGRLVRRGPAALRRRREQRQQHRPQQARHPVGPRRDPALRGLRDRRRPGGALAGVGRGGRPGRRRSTSGSRAGARRSTGRGRPTTCRRTPGPTSGRSRRWRVCRSGWSRWAPNGRRRWSSTIGRWVRPAAATGSRRARRSGTRRGAAPGAG